MIKVYNVLNFDGFKNELDRACIIGNIDAKKCLNCENCIQQRTYFGQIMRVYCKDKPIKKKYEIPIEVV